MTKEQLVDGVGGACLLDTGEHVSAAMARRLACEACGRARGIGVAGRRSRRRPPPGAYHKVPWSQGGPTTVQDATLLCSWHHHRAHDPGYRVEYLTTGKTRFHRRT